MASVSVNGITIEYEREGTGEPLLLVMGLGAQLTDWPPEFVAMLIDAGFCVIRLDNRDAGLSTAFSAPPPTMLQLARLALRRSKVRPEYRIGDMAADAVALLDAIGVESAHVVGQSMGGMIAQSMAIEHPTRVRSLTSIMASTGSLRVGRPRVSLLRKVARLSEPTRENAIEVGIEMQRAISGPHFDEAETRRMAEVSIQRSFRPAGVGRQTAAVVASPDRTERLAKVDAPTLVVHGMVDPLVAPSGGVATARAVPRSRLLMFNDMGHDLPRPRRQEIVGAIAANATRAAGASMPR